MTRTQLIEDLKVFIEDTVKDFILPTKLKKGDAEQALRSPVVFKQRVPDSRSATDKAPCILLQLTNATDSQAEGNKAESSAIVRIVFMIYCNDEQEGGMALLEVMERVRIALLKIIYLNNQYMLDLSNGMETNVYNDDTAPFYIGEMITTWHMPPVKREVNFNGY